MIRRKDLAVAALDPAKITARGHELGELLFFGAASGLIQPNTIPEVLGVGRQMVRITTDKIARATGIDDPAFRTYWGDLLTSAAAETFNGLNARSAAGGETEH